MIVLYSFTWWHIFAKLGFQQSLLKSRDITLPTKVCTVKATVFPAVQMLELDHKEGWAPRNWCFQTVVLEKSPESPLDSKDIKLINPKGNQPWIFIGRAETEAEAQWFGHLMQRADSPEKTLMGWGRSQDGGGVGQEDHFLPYKFIERTFERWANFTKQLLTTSRRHQALRKAAHRLWKEVGQNIKDKKRDKS